MFPGLEVWGGGDAAKIVSQSDGEGVEYGYAISRVRHTAATRDVPRYTAGVRARLEAAGWTVTGVDPPVDPDYVGANPGDREAGFAARRGDLGLAFSAAYWPGRPAYDSDGHASYHIWHQPPSWLVWPTWAGALIAALLAWFVTAWVSRTLEAAPGIGPLIAAGGIFVVLGVVPSALSALPGESTASETAAPYWQQLVYLGFFPAALSAAAAAVLIFAAVVLRGRRHVRGAVKWTARRPRVALVAVVAVLLGLGVYHLVPGSCRPSVPVGVQDPPDAALSYESRVFIAPDATDDQRNLAQAAIGRGFGGSFDFHAGTHSPGFTDAFCGHGRVSGPVAAELPWYWTVSLPSPGLFQGLAADVSVMPGVVAVQHLPGRLTHAPAPVTVPGRRRRRPSGPARSACPAVGGGRAQHRIGRRDQLGMRRQRHPGQLGHASRPPPPRSR